MYLQNEQENGGGALIASTMPKSGLEIYREKSIRLFSQESLTFYCVIPFVFMEEGRCPLYMGSRRFPSETEGVSGTLFAFYDFLFPLYSPTALIFYV